jgi:RNA polymerase sigma factor (sigma-70 family)
MTTSLMGAVLHHLRDAAGGTRGERTDRDLLDELMTGRDTRSFAELMGRHGPMVLRVCRRVLHHEQDAEDAFQVAFLVLARHAGSVRRREAVASWLHGVAYRTAMAAKRAAARRRAHEGRAEAMPRTNAPAELEWREVQAVLEEEVARLPERYRAPFVLCCLEGRDRAEAARELRLKEGTVSSRLGRARKQLQERLGRRGIALSVLLGAAALTEGAMPARLAAATSRAAAGGTVPAGTAELFREATRGLVATKCKTAMTVLFFVLGLAGLSGGLLARVGPPQKGGPLPAAASTERPKAPLAENALLDRHGDPLPPGALARFGTKRFRHAALVNDVTYSPDGRVIASASGSTAYLWEATTGRALRQLKGRGKWVNAVAFSPDGKTLASAGSYDDICLWDWSLGEERRRFPVSMRLVRGLAFTPDGKGLLAWGGLYATRDGKLLPSQGQLRLFDTTSGAERCAFRGHDGFICSAALSRDGKLLASASLDRTIRLWEVPSGKELRTVRLSAPFSKDSLHVPLTLAPDGKTVAVALADNTVRVYEVATGTERKLTGHSNTIRALAFSRDGKQLASAGWDNTVRLWDTATGKEKHVCRGHETWVESLAFSPDGKTLASGAHDHSIRLWTTATGKDALPFGGHRYRLMSIAVSPDARMVATGSADGICLWEAKTGKELRRLDGHKWVSCLAFSPNGKALISGGHNNTIHVWEVRTGRETRRLSGHKRGITSLAFTEAGKRLISASEDQTIRLWDWATGRELRRLGGEEVRQLGRKTKDGIRAVAVSPDGSTLALVPAADTVIRLCDLEGKGARQLKGHRAYPTTATFAPNGKLLASAGSSWRPFLGENVPHDEWDDALRLWDVASGKEMGKLAGTPDGRWRDRRCVNGVTFSPDGRSLASAEDNGPIVLYELATGGARWRLAGHEGSVRAVAFSPDGKFLVSAGEDLTALVWGLAGQGQRGALGPKELERLWEALRDRDGEKAHEALRGLVAAPAQVVPFLGKRLVPVPSASLARIEQLIADLDSNQFSVRERARRELERLEAVVGPALRKALKKGPPLEVRRQLEQLLSNLDGPTPSIERLRAMRAVEALELIGSAQARQVLEALAKGARGARMTQDARAALGRLGQRPAPP